MKITLGLVQAAEEYAEDWDGAVDVPESAFVAGAQWAYWLESKLAVLDAKTSEKKND